MYRQTYSTGKLTNYQKKNNFYIVHMATHDRSEMQHQQQQQKANYVHCTLHDFYTTLLNFTH